MIRESDLTMYRVFASFLFTIAATGCGDDGNPVGGSAAAGGAPANGGSGGEARGGDTQGGEAQGGEAQGGAGQGGEGGSASCEPPEGGVWATFDVVDDVYRAHITNPNGVQQALDLWAGTSKAAIPNGALVCASASFNCGWGFHQDPATIEFAEATIEVCDGTPSYVDANCGDFGAQYCPWSAVLSELRDCRSDPLCPLVP